MLKSVEKDGDKRQNVEMGGSVGDGRRSGRKKRMWFMESGEKRWEKDKKGHRGIRDCRSERKSKSKNKYDKGESVLYVAIEE